jgi:hypothetical membrane protein
MSTGTMTQPTRTRSTPIGRTAEMRLAGLLLLALAGGFLTVIMLGASMAPAYDMNAGAISDLGVTAQTALLFNVTVAVVGILNAAAGYLLYRWHGRRWVLAVFALASIGGVGVGLFPLSTGAPHSLFALLAFLSFNIEAIATRSLVTGLLRVVPVVSGVVGFAAIVAMVLGDSGVTGFGPIGHGGVERLIVYPSMLWLLALGGHLAALAAPGEGA